MHHPIIGVPNFDPYPFDRLLANLLWANQEFQPLEMVSWYGYYMVNDGFFDGFFDG